MLENAKDEDALQDEHKEMLTKYFEKLCYEKESLLANNNLLKSQNKKLISLILDVCQSLSINDNKENTGTNQDRLDANLIKQSLSKLGEFSQGLESLKISDNVTTKQLSSSALFESKLGELSSEKNDALKKFDKLLNDYNILKKQKLTEVKVTKHY